MKMKNLSVKICVLLLFLSSVIIVEAQKKKPAKKRIPRGEIIADNFATIAEIKDFAFVVEVDKNENVAVRVQKTETSDFLADSSSSKKLTDFFTAFSLLQNSKTSAKTRLEPIIIVKSDGALNFGKLLQIIKSLRISPKQKIKLQIAENYYVAVPPLINGQNLEVRPYPLTLIVELQGDSTIFLNREQYGNFSNMSPLKDKLEEVFREREENGVFREGSNEVEKTVFIVAPDTVKFSDVIKLIQSVAESGASPIGLQIEDFVRTINIEPIVK